MIGTAALSNLFAWALQAAILAGTAALAARLFHVDSPGVRYAWWRSVLVVCLVLPLVQPWQPAPSVPAVDPAPVELTPAAAAGRSGVPGAQPALPPLLPRAVPGGWPALVGVILLAGVLLRLAWLTSGLVRLRRLRRAGTVADSETRESGLDALLDRDVEIRYVDALPQPVTFGIVRPVVLLPDRLRALPPAVQRAVLAHELWHVRRRDWGWHLLEESIVAVLWFHPAVWYVVSRVQAAREELVDELSVLLTNARRSYLEALLAFADEPVLHPAAPFARRRHLFTRMLLISKEAVMSSRRIVLSSAVVACVLASAGWYGAQTFPLIASTPAVVEGLPAGQTPPRDPRPRAPRPPTTREGELKAAVAADPTSVQNWLELAKLQEQRGARDEAVSTFDRAAAALAGQPGLRNVLDAKTGFFQRTNQFDRALAALEELVALDPGDPAGHQKIAAFHTERARKDLSLAPAEKLTSIQAGMAATERALTYDPDHINALTYKNILLRMQANLEADPARQQQLVAEADALRTRAMELSKAGAGGVVAGAPPPPPPPPPPGFEQVDGQHPVRIGGSVAAPTKIRDVRPVYPAEARAAGVQGVVILEAVVDGTGAVRDARVLRSIPLLDEAALEAVRQWVFTPTMLNGAPVPVIMTVTVNFTMQ